MMVSVSEDKGQQQYNEFSKSSCSTVFERTYHMQCHTLTLRFLLQQAIQRILVAHK